MLVLVEKRNPILIGMAIVMAGIAVVRCYGGGGSGMLVLVA